MPPSCYLRNIYCDSVVHDSRSLRFLIDRIGWEHIVLGCDYPFGMGTDRAVDDLVNLGLPTEQTGAILGGTLADLLHLR